MNDITKLPKWAQMRIQKLEADVADHKATADRVVGGESRVYLGHFKSEARYIPDNEPLTFELGPHSAIHINIRQDKDGSQYLDVNSLGSRLRIEPSASNSVHIWGY